MTTTSHIEQFYDGFAESEWRRLERHRTEFAVTMRALQDWLPPAMTKTCGEC